MISFQKSIIFWSRWLYIICSCIEVTWIWLLSPSIWVYKATPWRVFINFRANTSNSMQFNISRFNSWKIIDESVKTWMVKIKRNVKYLNNRKRSFQSSPFESVHLNSHLILVLRNKPESLKITYFQKGTLLVFSFDLSLGSKNFIEFVTLFLQNQL